MSDRWLIAAAVTAVAGSMVALGWMRPERGQPIAPGTADARQAGSVRAGGEAEHQEACGGALAERMAEEIREMGKIPYTAPMERARFFVAQRVIGDQPLPIEKEVAETQKVRVRQAALQQGGVAGIGNEASTIPVWTEAGPGNIGGRTRALVIHPTDPDIMYAGGVAGGVWYTDDGGRNWRPIEDTLPNLAISSMVMKPTDPDVIYAGTGEGFFNFDALRGFGIYRITNNNGQFTVEHLASTQNSNFYYVNDLEISDLPGQSNIIFAATRSGVWRSRNGGNTWQLVLEDPIDSFTGATDIEMVKFQSLEGEPIQEQIVAAFGSFFGAAIMASDELGDSGSWVVKVSGAPSDVNQDRTWWGRITIDSSQVVEPFNLTDTYICMAYSLLGQANSNAILGELFGVFRAQNARVLLWKGPANVPPPFDQPISGVYPFLLSNGLFRLDGATGNVEECWECPDCRSPFAQGWYDNVIAVAPDNPDVVFVGGIDLFRTLNARDEAGPTWEVISYWFLDPDDDHYLHADQHVIAFHPDWGEEDPIFGGTIDTLFIGNDGGIFKTENALDAGSTDMCPFVQVVGGDWEPDPTRMASVTYQSLNNSYGVTQFYHGDAVVLPDGKVRLMGGTQDNGTVWVDYGASGDLNRWSEVWGGDGGYVAFHPANPDIAVVESQGFPAMVRLRFDAATNRWEEDAGLTGGIADSGLFISPFAQQPDEPYTLWSGGSKPWRLLDPDVNTQWENARRFPWSGEGFTDVDVGLISAIAVAPGTGGNVVYLGFDNGFVARTDNGMTSQASAITWKVFADGNGLEVFRDQVTGNVSGGAWVSSLAVHPNDPDTVYLTYSTYDVNHVYRSVDGGQTWEPLDGEGESALPNLPAHWVSLRPSDPGQLYVGTEAGVFFSPDAGQTWEPANGLFDGAMMPNTRVERLKWIGNDRVVGFTHGRGAFIGDLQPLDNQRLLTIEVSPEGAGTTSPAPGTHTFTLNEQVTITATPAATWGFLRWEGPDLPDAQKTSKTITVSMNQTRYLRAVFGRTTLSVSVNPPEGGTVDPPPGDTLHGVNDVVTLTATPNSGFTFDSWTGSAVADALSPVTTIVMDTDKSVTANFRAVGASVRPVTASGKIPLTVELFGSTIGFDPAETTYRWEVVGLDVFAQVGPDGSEIVSTDPDVEVVHVAETGSLAGRDILLRFLRAGDFLVRFSAIDARGGEARAHASIEAVGPVVAKPTVAISAIQPDPANNPRLFEFSAVVSGFSGEVFGYLWTFGDGTEGSGEVVEHEYESPGSYRVTLTVDSSAGVVTTSQTVSVPEEAPEQPGPGQPQPQQQPSGQPAPSGGGICGALGLPTMLTMLAGTGALRRRRRW